MEYKKVKDQTKNYIKDLIKEQKKIKPETR